MVQYVLWNPGIIKTLQGNIANSIRHTKWVSREHTQEILCDIWKPSFSEYFSYSLHSGFFWNWQVLYELRKQRALLGCLYNSFNLRFNFVQCVCFGWCKEQCTSIVACATIQSIWNLKSKSEKQLDMHGQMTEYASTNYIKRRNFNVATCILLHRYLWKTEKCKRKKHWMSTCPGVSLPNNTVYNLKKLSLQRSK